MLRTKVAKPPLFLKLNIYYALNPIWNGRTNLWGESVPDVRNRIPEARFLFLVSDFWSLTSGMVGLSFDPNPSANLVSVEREGG